MPAAARPYPWGPIGLAAFVLVSVVLLFIFAPSRHLQAAMGGLALDQPLPEEVPPGVTLTVGDPVTQWVVEHNGWAKNLPFRIKWVRITGGPDVTEAFHADALDVGLGANIPPIHAQWVGIPIKIIAFRQRRDPLNHPAFVLGIAPKAHIRSIADLRGKRIAFSPSQVQGLIVLQTLKGAGLTRNDVKLVELPSSIGGDVYTSSLASNVVDMAPLGYGIVSERYLRKFGADGARIIPHPPFRDDPAVAYVRVTTLRDPAKAAALRQFAALWGRTQAWENQHPGELARGYYEQHEGLSPADAQLIMDAAGKSDVPGDWRNAIAYQQAAIDMMAPDIDKPRFEAAAIFDRRFQAIAADAFTAQSASEATSNGLSS